MESERQFFGGLGLGLAIGSGAEAWPLTLLGLAVAIFAALMPVRKTPVV